MTNVQLSGNSGFSAASMAAAGATAGATAGGGAKPRAIYSDRRFNFDKAKARVFRAFEDTETPSKFRAFFKSELMDMFLHATIAYFVAFFNERRSAAAAKANAEDGGVAGGGEGAGGGDGGGEAAQGEATGGEQGAGADAEKAADNADAFPTSAAALASDVANAAAADCGDDESHADLVAACEARLADVAPVYAQIIMNCSDYEHTQQDKLFFESLYEATNLVLQEAFAGQRRGHDVELELGRIFRTKYFNLSRRRGAAGAASASRKQDTLSIRELYALKHEGDPALNSRILAQLYAKRERGSVVSGANRVSAVIAKMLPKGTSS